MKARFVSRSANYAPGIQSLVKESFGTGESKVIKRRLDAQFQRSLVTDADYAFALGAMHFPGLPFDEDTNQTVSPRFRLSVWDSEYARTIEGWTDAEVDLAIEKLRAMGGNGGEFVEIPAVAPSAPWPAYDEATDIEAIVALARQANFDVEAIIAYEQENQNRDALIALLREEPEAADAVVIEA